MSLTPEDEGLAAEYALGTLDPGERATAAARRRREPELDAAIRAWENRLAPLAEEGAAIDPPQDYLTAIEARLDAAPAPTASLTSLASRTSAAPRTNVAALAASRGRWRALALMAASLAAVLAVVGGYREASRQATPHEFVAVLQKSADSPAFAVSINIDTRELTVRPVSATAPEGRAYELWIIADSLGAPRSLGLIDASATVRNGRLAGVDAAVVQDATYAVTVEPPGGSPNGKPSGAPVFVGKLIPVGP